MKTKLLQISAVLIFLLLQNGCGDSEKTNAKESDPSCEQQLEELTSFLDEPFNFEERMPSKFNFCETTEAVLPETDYNTKTGIAQFSIPIPKGSNLSFLEQKGDTLYYNCNGYGKVKYGSDNLFQDNKIALNLPRKTGHIIWVSVVYKNFDGSTCNNNLMFQEKKKKSEVQGQPFRED
ncbi:hypothetical protein [Winogradskyella ursingii]|uniref:hypothetical protein n=1 Tax=Winogradskyella ursingii TaxID=2686079 RepID=UPI0015C7E437|nr:hypothetical protein [Winogradskyella ursingii]